MQHTWRLRRGGAVAVAMPMVVLVLLGLVEKVVHQNGGKGGKEDLGGDGREWSGDSEAMEQRRAKQQWRMERPLPCL
jgi:hypothetical protein